MTRVEILEAAAQIFSQKGYQAASMQDIAEAVHLQKASLYYYISSKQEILLALLDKALDMLIERMETVLALPHAPDKKLREAMQTYLLALLENRDLASVLLLEYRSLEPELHARHLPRRDRFERLWRVLIEEGVDKQVFDCSDPALASRYLLGLMNWTITWYRKDGSLSPGEIADRFSNYFLLGLLARGNRNGK